VIETRNHWLLEEAQHHGLLSSPQAAITEAVHATGDDVAALFGGRRTIDRHGSVQNGLQLGERQQMFGVHINHYASHHDAIPAICSDSNPVGITLPVQTQTPLLDKACLLPHLKI
jgi:hypothetical protein